MGLSATGHNSKPITMKLSQVAEVVSTEMPIDFEVEGQRSFWGQCSWKSLFVLNWSREAPFPIPWRWGVVTSKDRMDQAVPSPPRRFRCEGSWCSSSALGRRTGHKNRRLHGSTVERWGLCDRRPALVTVADSTAFCTRRSVSSEALANCDCQK